MMSSSDAPPTLPLTQPGVAIITGASSGIGRATAIALAAAGWTCALSGRNGVELNKTAKEIERVTDNKARHWCFESDLAKEGAVEALFDGTIRHFGRVDLLFNNAGIASPRGAPDEIDLDAFETLLKINVTVPFHCTKLAFRQMKAQRPQGGRIVNNGSLSAFVPRPRSAPYTLSKHAITGLTKSTSLDGRPYRIACSQIDIGNAQSSISIHHSTGHEQANGSVMKEEMIDARYVAQTVVYLASLPLEVNILNQTVMATNMPFVGRG